MFRSQCWGRRDRVQSLRRLIAFPMSVGTWTIMQRILDHTLTIEIVVANKCAIEPARTCSGHRVIIKGEAQDLQFYRILLKELSLASSGDQVVWIPANCQHLTIKKKVGEQQPHKLRTKSDCCLYHVGNTFVPGTQFGPAGSISPTHRASFINSQAKILGDALYLSTMVRT